MGLSGSVYWLIYAPSAWMNSKSCFVGAYISILVSQGPPTASQSAFKQASLFHFPQRASGDIVKQFTLLAMDMT